MPLDFSYQNLRGRSFKNHNLINANFNYADIRGANFSYANLKGAKFTGVKAGLQNHWIIISLFLIILLSAVISALFSLTSTAVLLGFFAASKYSIETKSIFSLVCIIEFTVFFIVTAHKGLLAGLQVITGSGVIFIAIISIFFNGAFAFASIAILTIAITITLPIAVAVAITIAEILGFIFIVIVNIIVVSGSVILIFALSKISIFTLAKVGVVLGCETFVLFSICIGWRTLTEDKKDSWVRSFAIAFATTFGTSFYESDLTDVDFSCATLKNTDFRNTTLTRTCWHNAKQLNCVRPGNTYLQHRKVRQLLVGGKGQNKNFDREDLRGVNLQGANLVDSSFIGTDLSHANLQNANLSRAKLVQTQLDGTDFTGATLTGTYIEDWNITTDTKFDEVRCEYVYMHLPTPDNPDPHRKPDNRQEVFADGEFGDFIKPIFDTLDLYHNQGVDPRAIAISFKQLAENHPQADLQIVGMEVRGEDKFLLRAKTAAMADKSELSAEYFDTYNQIKGLPEREIKLLLAEKDNQIRRLENMVMTALERPSFYSNVEQVGFMTNNPGGFSVGGSVDGDINNVQGENNQQRVSNKTSNFNLQNAQFGGGLVNADTVNAEQIGGNITNYNTEQRQNLAQAATDIQQLLNQLSQSYPTATTSQKMAVVARAVDEIENNPTLKARVIGALKAGGTEAFKELIDHPLVNILLASIDGWQEAE
ncbi:MAG: pentapeptide repeat-containing protein [Nostoc sp. DedSLP03]|uniref:pentapeptide repeat-containing protein n=1 Tax=Nostoc sp. DedSLP03 TaxID=3075400 RepID=UPI002AD4DF9F|nr:pentapeptide repeat-containing protein [Nostoc sp. DedSLP03]MDZ7970421.1 pentapeptide repeat-containing protein [Nostoc sp. DedSLP03]